MVLISGRRRGATDDLYNERAGVDMLLCLSASPPTVHSSPLPSAALIYLLKHHFYFFFSYFCLLKFYFGMVRRGRRGGIKTLGTKLFPKDQYLLGAFFFFFPHPPFPSYWLPLHLLDQCIPRRKQSPPLTTPVTISVRVSLIKLQRGGTRVEPGLMYARATSNNIHQATETPEMNQTLQKNVDHMANLKFRTFWFLFDHTTALFSTSYWKTLHLDRWDPSLVCEPISCLWGDRAVAWVGIHLCLKQEATASL